MIDFKFKPSQKKAINAIISGQYDQIVYAGTAGTGKTYTVALTAIGLANDFKGTRVGVFRKSLVSARKGVLQTYLKALNDFNIPHSWIGSPNPIIRLTNSNSTIEFYPLDMGIDPDWKTLNGLEISFAHVDEADEVHISGINKLTIRTGRWNENGVPKFTALTCNPAYGFIRDEFRDPFINGTLASHRAFIETGADELEPSRLKQLESLPREQYERFVLNNWDFNDNPNQLVKYEWLKDNLIEPKKEAKFMGVDVARTGKDLSMIAYATDNELTGLEAVNTDNTMVLADTVYHRAIDYSVGFENIRIDAVGVGGGVVDSLLSRKFKVYPYMSGYRPEEDYGHLLFTNRRAQDYWNIREMLRNNELKIVNDSDLIKQLTSIEYYVRDKYIHIESKDEIKKRLGVSPDKADAAVMALAKIKKKKYGYVMA